LHTEAKYSLFSGVIHTDETKVHVGKVKYFTPTYLLACFFDTCLKTIIAI
tara:strand:- start:1086 stop:1235 length:150 start_codon:yes stop_codon:yes gene_type:complete